MEGGSQGGGGEMLYPSCNNQIVPSGVDLTIGYACASYVGIGNGGFKVEIAAMKSVLRSELQEEPATRKLVIFL